MSATPHQFELMLSSVARVEERDGVVHVAAANATVRLGVLPRSVVAALQRLVDGGATESHLCDAVHADEGTAALVTLYGVMQTLDAAGLLARRLSTSGPLATLTPVARGFRFRDALPAIPGGWKLSRFAYLRPVGGTWRVECPLGFAHLELHDAAAARFVFALAGPTPHRTREDSTTDALLLLLWNAGALAPATDDECPGADGTPSAGWWEFHDLLFHARSRRGRSSAPYGGTYRIQSAPAPPLVRPETGGAVIALPEPDLETLRQTDRPFADVLERRRSVREYGTEPIALEQLAEFLYRSARIQRVLPGGPIDHAFRPSPAGGALQELEVYPVVACCRGLETGIYRYGPLGHTLTPIPAPAALVEQLLEQAWITGDKRSPLNVYFGITARCRRVFWKYESMGYALILKNLGALYATMYLVATAMGLAPCALGGGDSELFARTAGLDPLEEPAVGEFLLGSRPVPS